MNFSFLDVCPELEKLRRYCYEAEKFALSYPEISVTAARKAMEYLVKILYGSVISDQINGLTVYDMLSDPAFNTWLADAILMNRFHYIRKMGNQSVHQGGTTSDVALRVLENLHVATGEICLRLELIRDYAPFDPQLECEEPEAEPTVDRALFARIAGRLHNVFSPSQQRNTIEIVEKFIGTNEFRELKKSDPTAKGMNKAANTRVAFQIIAEFFANTFGAEHVLADYHELLLFLKAENRQTVLAIRTACCRVAVKNSQGEWLYLPGIDYVLYTDQLKTDIPVLEQFRVFTPQEFLNLWQGINHLHPVVSSGTAKRLKKVLGEETKISIGEYADELKIQTLSTAHRKKKQTIAETLETLPALNEEGLKKILDQKA